jgi:hypothetical protein
MGWQPSVAAKNAQNTIVSDEGNLVVAKRFGVDANVTINGVTFIGTAQSYGTGQGVGTPTYTFFSDTGTASPELISLYSYFTFGIQGGAHTISGLTTGATYMLQWFFADERTSGDIATRNQSVTIANYANTFPAQLVAKATKCYFVATSTSHDIVIGGNEDGHIAAFQVRQIPAVSTSLSASAATINFGTSASLTWSATNAAAAAISPGVGPVSITGGSIAVAPTSTTTYTITAFSSVGLTATASVTVSVVTTPPVIGTQPASQTIVSGSTATLTVMASGGGTLSYAWYQGTSGTTTTSVGTNAASFTTPSLTSTTSYWVRVTNSAGSVDSSTATVTVTAPVPVISSPDTATGTVGTPFSYQIVASSNPTSYTTS